MSDAASATYDRRARALDIAVAGVLLVALAPLMLAIAVIIRLTSPGSVIFRQERIGRHGEPFDVCKFRTMRSGVSDERHRAFVTGLITGRDDGGDGGDDDVFKLVDDDRITTVGRWLRRTSLDELPQLFNVLEGSMSLVGPRPGLSYEVDLYDDVAHQRLLVVPGITGLWQVSGRNHLSMREMFELDARYVETRSIATDLRILVRTPREMVRPSGAQ